MAYFFAPDDTLWFSYFGGPSECELAGVKHGPQSIHHVFTLSSVDLDRVEGSHFDALPLFYGMVYDGCQLSYAFPSSHKCQIRSLKPTKSSSSWPYKNYPPLLPYVPMKVVKRARCTEEDFSRLAPQGIELAKQTIAVIVPPTPLGGVSLWGPWGEQEGVQLVFRCDLETRIVHATNQCT